MDKVRNVSIRLAALVIALVVAIVAFSAYGNSQSTNAAYSTRYYRRHDYSSSNLSTYTTYSLSVEQKERYITPPNGMVRDNDTAVVRLNGIGTGFIVGKHVIATAAHCVFDNDSKKFETFTIDIVGNNNNVLKTITPKYVDICSSFVTYTDSPNYKYDYALIYVEDDISEYRVFSLGLTLDWYISYGGTVIASGFPQYPPSGYDGVWTATRFRSAGGVDSVHTNSYFISHDADAINGDSGGPLYVEEGFEVYENGSMKTYEYKTVIGIVSHGTHDKETGEAYDNAVRVDSNLLKFYCGNTNLPT